VPVKFSEVVKLLEQNGFAVVKMKGSVRYYGKPGWDKLVRVDYHMTHVKFRRAPVMLS
jgi:predicted RNA binding protein YcfA (HicA-like mRNA interferase family)